MEDKTDFETRCEILAELWVGYKMDETFAGFIQYNDLGLPLAYAVSAEIAAPNTKIEGFVNETFDLFMKALDIEDTGFDSLNDIFVFASGEA